MREWLPTLAVNRPVSVVVAFIGLIVLGLIAWGQIPLQLMPDGLEADQLFVQIPNPGSTPRETDERVVAPVYAQLATIPGVASIRTNAEANSAGFQIQFAPGGSVDEAYNNVIDRLERALPDLPDEADRYLVFKFDPGDIPIIFGGVSIPETVDDPGYLVERVIGPAIERVPGVASIDTFGVPKRQIYIEFDREKIIAHALDVGSVQRRLQSDNFQMASGKVEEKGSTFLIRSLSEMNDVNELATFPVRDGIVLSDIATISQVAAMSSDIGRLNGKGAAILIIRKESGANLVEVTSAVRNVFNDLNADSRLGGAELIPFFDQGELVEDGLDNLTWTAALGGLCALVILFSFLREWRMTLLIAWSIPFSLLITVGVLYFRGDSLNLLSLMGLMLAVGMVVDNGIVAVETIYRRRGEGESPRDAAIRGTAEINLAIIMSTLTSMVVFLPLILMAGNAQFTVFLGALGLPVILALAASLLVALIFAPLTTTYMKRGQVRQDPPWLRGISAIYQRILRFAITRRLLTLPALLTLLIIGFIPIFLVDCQAVDEDSQNQFDIKLEVPPQFAYGDRSRVVAEVEDLLSNNKDHWRIDGYFAEIRSSSNRGRVSVFLQKDESTFFDEVQVWLGLAEGPLSRSQIMDEVKAKLPKDEPGTTWTIGFQDNSTAGTSVDFTIRGENMDTLLRLGEEAARRVAAYPGVLSAAIEDEQSQLDELQMNLRRDSLQRYGLTPMSVAGTVSFYLRGTGLDPLLIDGKEVDVITRFELDDRDDLESVLDSPIFSPTVGRLVPLRALSDVAPGKGPDSIRRFDNQTGVRVRVDLEDGTSTTQGYKIIEAGMKDMVFPRNYTWKESRGSLEEAEGILQQVFVILMSITFVYLLMGILFESWLLPLSILATLPLAVTGTWWLLWLTDTPFDTMSGIGVVILIGVVVNNGIVLVDLITQLRTSGMSRHEAILEAGRRRLRPILMTAFTTIFGLIPMAVGTSDFVGIPYAPLGRTVIGGLAAATVLTLVVVPYIYLAIDDLSAWVQKRIYIVSSQLGPTAQEKLRGDQ